MSINFDSNPYGTSLIQKVQKGLPSLGFGNGIWILVRNTAISLFSNFKNLFVFVGSSVACSLTIAAFIRDVPTIFATIERISLGAISIWTTQSRAAFLTHIVSYYLWPIGINLLRGFFLTAIGAIVVSWISLPVRCYQNFSKYNAQKDIAIEHVRNIQLIANEIIKLIPKKNPTTYLTEALQRPYENQGDKKTLFNNVLRSINPSFTPVTSITGRECIGLKKAIEKKISNLNSLSAYQQLEVLFMQASDASDVSTNAFIAETLKTSWAIGATPQQCLELLINGFKEPKFEGGTLQLLTCLHNKKSHPQAFKVSALYKQLMAHAKGYEAAVTQMQNIYGFIKPSLQIDQLW